MVEIESPLKAGDPALDATQGDAYGTDPANDMTGRINEFLVASIFYDLLDPGNEPGNDEIWPTNYLVGRTLVGYMGSSSWNDRGGAGKDLVDSLDGWRCYEKRIHQQNGDSFDESLLTKLVSFRQFGYTAPATATNCP